MGRRYGHSVEGRGAGARAAHLVVGREARACTPAPLVVVGPPHRARRMGVVDDSAVRAKMQQRMCCEMTCSYLALAVRFSTDQFHS